MTINLGDYYKAFITKQLESKRYGTASAVVKAALRLLEEKETPKADS
jgi:antitoxin ParD1/3/4